MITTIIIILTGIVSAQAFSNRDLMNKLIFHPTSVNNSEWYRLFSYGLIHADWGHLLFNMLTLYFFGPYIESFFATALGGSLGVLCYILLYISALFVSIYPTYRKEKNNAGYYGLGASGAVSTIVFAYILIKPMGYMGLLFIPVFIPAFLFGILYVFLSLYFNKTNSGQINHLAHITGGIYGVIMTALIMFLLADINLFALFAKSIQNLTLDNLFHVGY